MKNRALSVFIVLLLTAALVLCALAVLQGRLPTIASVFTTTEAPPPPTVPRPAALDHAGRSRYHYEGLSPAQRRVYDDLLLRLPGFPENVAIREDLDSDTFYEAFQALTLDQPLLFHVSSHYRTRHTESGRLAAFLPEYRMDAAEYETKCEALALVCASMAASGTEYERELALHDALVRLCDYTDTGPEIGTAYGALVEKKASCEGYAKAMLLLLELSGISSGVIIGEAVNPDGQPGGHAWNKVFIEGAWYHLDATWNDPVSQEGPSASNISRAYFNLSDADMALTHANIKTKPGELPQSRPPFDDPRNPCVSNEANYFVRQGLYFTAFDKSAETAVAQRLAEALAAGDDCVELRLSGDAAYQGALKELFGKNTQRVYRILSNAALSGPYPIRTDKVRHTEVEALHIIRILPERK